MVRATKAGAAKKAELTDVGLFEPALEGATPSVEF
jgi:hypothetical protein